METIYKISSSIYGLLRKVRGTNVSANDMHGSNVQSVQCNCLSQASEAWDDFIKRSFIHDNVNYVGNQYAGYLKDVGQWILPSWIWTNAASVRVLCGFGAMEEAQGLVEILARQQQDCGGWVVRNDYDKRGAIPVLAPNDSAYIANNAFLTLYAATGESRYLEIAKKCADWIIETVRPDGMVYTGYNLRDGRWSKSSVIVDVGFTGGLFANLYDLTMEEKYKVFLQDFIRRYIDLFYIPKKAGFATSIDKDDRQQGGMFARGQAWALEGLIPAYDILDDKNQKNVIQSTIDNLIAKQCRHGGWPYNLTRPLLGEDCKAVPVIAKNMMEWYRIVPDERIKESAKKALDWCVKHTAQDSEARGGIFSYCYEGAIVMNHCSSCAFVYASAYALELKKMLEDV